MGLISREIIQSVKYDDSAVKVPSLNYSETFPITVFDAVRESMNDADSITLSEVLADIKQELKGKQPLLPGKSADYLMTFAGTPGGVGSIKISHSVPIDPNKQSQEKIPTEKAIGELIRTIGLVDDKGNSLLNPDRNNIRWFNIIDRPLAYDSTGYNENGFMTQKAVTVELYDLRNKFNDLDIRFTNDDRILDLKTLVENHISNEFNPHKINLNQIGAASKDTLDYHLSNFNNPHNVTAEQVGLGNVDNTSDKDKPLSDEAINEFNKIKSFIDTINENVTSLDFVENIEYRSKDGLLVINYSSGKFDTVYLPTEGLIDEIKFDKDNSKLIIYQLNGEITEINLHSLSTYYEGVNGSTINVDVDNDNLIIRATINDNSILGTKLANNTITGDKIDKGAINTDHISNNAVTKDKLAKYSVSTGKLEDRSVNEKKIFTTPNSYQILAVTEGSTDPNWRSISTEFIDNYSITNDKLSNNSVTTHKIADKTIINSKLADRSVNTNNLVNDSVNSDKLAANIELKGTPVLRNRPIASSDSYEIPDTHWVRRYVDNKVFTSDNIGNRTIDGSKLFTSEEDNRILAVKSKNTNPVWTQVNNGMIADNAVTTNKILDQSITNSKISNLSITNSKIANTTISGNKLQDGTITFDKIFPADNKDYIIATNKDGAPVYTKLSSSMIELDAITTDLIKHGSVTTDKIKSTSDSYTVLAVKTANSNPQFTKILSSMMSDSSVNGRILFKSDYDNKVLITSGAKEDAVWGTINHEMLDDNSVGSNNIIQSSIERKHLTPNIIDIDNFVTDFKLPLTFFEDNSVEPSKLVTSKVADRVLGVNTPYGEPKWMQVSTNMITDFAVTARKIFSSNVSNRVLAVTSAGSPPEYTMVTGDYITDRTITSSKLIPDIVLAGLPQITVHPTLASRDYHIATTEWVKWIVEGYLNGTITPEGPIELPKGCECEPITEDDIRELTTEILAEFETKFETKINKRIDQKVEDNKCTCVPDTEIDDDLLNSLIDEVWTKLNGDSFIPGNGSDGTHKCDCTDIDDERLNDLLDEICGINGGLGNSGNICNGECINQDKLDDILANLCKEDSCVHPPINEGKFDKLIDEILGDDYLVDGNINSGSCSNVCNHPPIDSDIFNALLNEILGNDIYPSDDNIMGGCTHDRIPIKRLDALIDEVLGKWNYEFNYGGESNGDYPFPPYSGIIEVEVRSIDGSKLFSSKINNTVLVVNKAGTDAVWSKITTSYIVDSAITTTKIADYSITNSKLGDSSINARKIVNNSINSDKIKNNAITTNKLDDSSVTTPKLVDKSVTRNKLADNAIDSSKIAKGSITTDLLADGSVTTPKLANSAVTTEKINNKAVTNSKIADKAISTNKLADESVTTPKLAKHCVENINIAVNAIATENIIDYAVTTAKLASLSVTTNKLADRSVTHNKIYPGAVIEEKIATNAVTTSKIKDLAVTNSKIGEKSVTSNKIADYAVKTINIDNYAVTTIKLDNFSVTNNKIADNSIDNPKLMNDCIATRNLQDECVTNEKLADDSVSTEKIVDFAITASKIANKALHTHHISDDFTITNPHLADESVTGNKIAPKSIESIHLTDDLVLPGKPSVEGNTDYEIKQIRNIIISDREPDENDINFKNGDIWFMYY